MTTISAIVDRVASLTDKPLTEGAHGGSPGHDGGAYWAPDGAAIPSPDEPAWMAPAVFLQKGVKKVPSLKELQQSAAEAIPALYPLIGFGNANARHQRTAKHLVMYFLGLESPGGAINPEGQFLRHHSFSGALCLRVVDEGLAWVLLSTDDVEVFEAASVDAFLAGVCKALEVDVVTRDDLRKGRFALIHEEPDCNWQPPPRSFF